MFLNSTRYGLIACRYLVRCYYQGGLAFRPRDCGALRDERACADPFAPAAFPCGHPALPPWRQPPGFHPCGRPGAREPARCDAGARRRDKG